MKKDTKGVILEKAYLLFLEKGYDSVSISMIQKQANIGRATLYHYFASKEELFTAVMEHYFKAAKHEENPDDWNGILLSKYLENRIKEARIMLDSSTIPDNIGMLNYFILTFQALGIDPKLAEQSYRIHELETMKWKAIITNSIKVGEVKKGIDVDKTAKLFMNIRHGIGVTSTFNTTMKDSVEAIDEMYKFIFSLIKSNV